MDNTLISFTFQDCSLRVIKKDGEPWFVAKDVAETLGYASTNMPQIFSHVPDEWKGSNPIATPGGPQDMLCLSEHGLYFFLGRSDKPLALPYQKWIAGEVVPTIRKKGSYAIPGKDQEDQEEWKKNFPYPFLLLDGAEKKMREMRLAVSKGILSAMEYRAVVLGDFHHPVARKDDEAITLFAAKNLRITASSKDFVLIRDAYGRYSTQMPNPSSQNIFTRKITRIYPAIKRYQKKIAGYPELVFGYCTLRALPAPVRRLELAVS
jgi:prophage antirepressor-like protein